MLNPGNAARKGDHCVTDCPEGFLSNYEEGRCEDLSNTDAKVIYFPFLIVTLLVFCLSWVGSTQKKKHLLVVNFIIMMGILEHIALLTQILLIWLSPYLKAKALWLLLFVVIYIGYWALNIAFLIMFKKDVIDKDKFYIQWRMRSENLWSRKLMNALGFISWKEYKLTYSGFWGYRIRSARFQSPGVYREIQRKIFWWNIGLYILIIVLAVFCFTMIPWGTQLPIMCIEIVVISIIMTFAGLWE